MRNWMEGAVGDQARESAQRIDFANNLALGNAADGGVAAHLGNFVHIHRDEAGFCTHAGCCRCCLATGVTGSDDHHIVIEYSIHIGLLFF